MGMNKFLHLINNNIMKYNFNNNLPNNKINNNNFEEI